MQFNHIEEYFRIFIHVMIVSLVYSRFSIVPIEFYQKSLMQAFQ